MPCVLLGAAAPSVRRVRRESDFHSFFFEAIPVPPTRFRPASKLGDAVFENPANVHLTSILKGNARVIESKDGGPGNTAGGVGEVRRPPRLPTVCYVPPACL